MTHPHTLFVVVSNVSSFAMAVMLSGRIIITERCAVVKESSTHAAPFKGFCVCVFDGKHMVVYNMC